ncbi:hypothetical protein C8R45DRAFT_1038799 [Mycena sanguinolenta]|nr:hypothetical protein C8R45DRAFT_1038799 [Mycena sanguinolenta]
MSCAFVNATFGECLGAEPATTTVMNSGAPTPVAIPLSRMLNEISAPSRTTSATSLHPTSSQNDNPVPAATRTKPALGPIIGGAFGGLVLVVGALLTMCWCRRRRLRHAANVTPRAYSDSNALSDIPTAELMRTLYRRINNQDLERVRTPSPPQYSAARVKV